MERLPICLMDVSNTPLKNLITIDVWTKISWVVESANSRIKKWKALEQVVPNTEIKWIWYIKIVSTIVNVFQPVLTSNSNDDIAFATEMKTLSSRSNDFKRRCKGKYFKKTSNLKWNVFRTYSVYLVWPKLIWEYSF